MPNRLDEKIVFVAGGGSEGEGWGIGKSCAVVYAREGARVFVVDINAKAAEETAQIIKSEGGTAVAAVADLSDEAQVEASFKECLAAFGGVDILHNNIGVTKVGSPPALSLDQWNDSWRLNVTSMFLTTRTALPLMERQRRGAIVNIGSVAAYRYLGVPYTAYYTTKAAVLQFTKVVAVEYAAKNIRANVVSPCFVEGPNSNLFQSAHGADSAIARITSTRANQNPMLRMGTGFDVAYASVYLASEEANYVTGTEIVVDGGVSAAAVFQ